MEFNIDPYNDDFELNAKDNNYLRILFKPGYAVQARELTQIQSILQNQIKSFGDHIFADGSPVIGGNLALDNNVTYIKLEPQYDNEDIEPEDFVGKIILRDSDSAVQAKVLASYYPAGSEEPIAMIKYLSGVNFDDGDVFRVAGTTTRAALLGTSSSGFGTIVSINDGIFYVDGFFVKINPQTAVVDATGVNANVKIGLEVTDDVIESSVDSTLLDPAQGSFNYQAPGADRYQFNLQLSTRPLTTAVDESKFFELMRLENGAITKQIRYPIYSEIEKTLARRTHDESGDYTVIPFRASVSDAADSNNYIINIEPGKAYVKGFEFETIGTLRMETEKPREDGIDTRSLTDIDFNTSYGNYLKFKNLYGNNTSAFLDTDILETVDLHVGTWDKINVGGTDYNNTRIGTAQVRAVQRAIPSGDPLSDSDGVFNIYFGDINIKPRVFKVAQASVNSNSVVLTSGASAEDDVYNNVSISVLPIRLDAVANVNTANVWAYSTRVNANSAVANVFSSPNVSVGSIVRVNDEVREVVNVQSDHFFVNSVFTTSFEGTDDTTNPLEVLVQTSYSSNVTNQVRRVLDYDGSTRTITVDRDWDESANVGANTVVQLNFGIKDLKCLVETDGTNINAHANISVQSTLLDGSTELFDADRKGLIFPLPKSFVKRTSLVNIDYNNIKFVELTGAAGTFTHGLDADESIPWSLTNNNIEDNLVAVVRESDDTANIANGVVLPLTTSEVSITTGLAGTVEIDTSSLTGNVGDIAKIDLYVKVKVNDAEGEKRLKAFHSNTNYTVSPFTYPANTDLTIDHTVTIDSVNRQEINVQHGLAFVVDPSMTNVFPGDSITINVPDVVKVRRILKGNTTHLPDADNYQDITNHFVVDYGQSDTLYDHCKLILKQGYPAPNSQMTVHFDFFEHTGSGDTFFSVDSYETSVYEGGNIPIYYSKSGGVYYLQDCLDFRSVKTIGTTNTYSIPRFPAPDSSTELSFDYYLPRIDKLVLSKNKEFRILKGQPSPKPVPPDDSDDAMTLYTIYLPPFVSRVNDIRLKYNENKRYTMKDIARIDKRVGQIEYYTALSSIESMAMYDETKYEDGTEKAKFGIIGEGFKNFNIADYQNPDFNVTMDDGEMMPYINNRPYGLKLVSATNVDTKHKTLSTTYTEEEMISQPVTSNKLISVQPFLFAQFIGDVNLSPDMDYWVSETLAPDVLRAPEIDGRVREIFNAERIANQIEEGSAPISVPTPTTNAANQISSTTGDDPPVADTDFDQPVINPTPPPVITIDPRDVWQPRSIFDVVRTLVTVREPAPEPTITPVPTVTTTSITAGGSSLTRDFTRTRLF